MAQLQSTMAEVILGPGYQIVFEAVDPVTGDPVSGVVITSSVVGANDVSASTPANPISITPILIPTDS